MNAKKLAFLKEILGDEGAEILKRASDQPVGGIIFPRAVLSWLDCVSSTGVLPGVEVEISLVKSEGNFTGKIDIDGNCYEFNGAAPAHVAAAITVALGGQQLAPDTQWADVALLGRSIDMLVKSRIFRRGRAKGRSQDEFNPKDLRAAAKEENEEHSLGEEASKNVAADHLTEDPNYYKKDEKAGGQGGPAKPIADGAPTPPVATQPQQGVKRGLKRPQSLTGPSKMFKSIKLTKAQQDMKCPVCKALQVREDAFIGCHCFKVLAKSVKAVVLPGGKLELQLGEDWDADAIATFLEGIHG